MSSTISTSNITSGFIDLATAEELEKYLYGSHSDSTNYFELVHESSTWFTQVPVVLARASGSPEWGNQWSVSISRAGDYLLHSWLRLKIPAITATEGKFLAWTPNLMHNLIKECSITFNDLSAASFTNVVLDFITAFTVPEGKREGYNTMIGNTLSLTTPARALPETVCNLPLPFFFSKDSGVSLPTCSLPYNDMRMVFDFRSLSELLTCYAYTEEETDDNGEIIAEGFWTSAPATSADYEGSPELGSVQVWANYSLVSNESRRKMGATSRDIVIEQHQTSPSYSFSPYSNPYQSYDIRFSHSVKALFWGVQNTTVPSVLSNYTVAPANVPAPIAEVVETIHHDAGSDPIDTTTLIYENTQRLAALGSDYFSLVQPYYQPNCVIPTKTGLHMYSYSLDMVSVNAMGSTNFGKLTNISLVPSASQDAIDANSPSGGQSFRFVVFCVSNNIARISGGAWGFPVL